MANKLRKNGLTSHTINELCAEVRQTMDSFDLLAALQNEEKYRIKTKMK